MPDYTFDITSSNIAANITEETTAVEVAENVLEVNITESTLAAGLSEDTLTTNITTDSLDVIIAEGYTFAVSGTTSLSLGTVGINTVAITSDGGVDDVTLPVATNASAGMASSAHITKLEGIPSDATADQTSIVGISGTLAEFNTALSDGTFATGGGTVTGTNTGVNTGDNTVCTSGTATTATTLETPRTIGGVAFDGSANINLSGVNIIGDQDTTGNASTATTATTVSDNAITLSKMASGTTGNLLTYDTLGDPAYVTTGSATQVLTSNGVGAAPTFQTITASHDVVTLNTTATNGGLSLDVQELNFRAATDAQTGYATAAHIQAITANTAKVTNSTHTGDVTGSTTLTIDKTAITGQDLVTALGTDYVVISDTTDSGNLKKALISDVANAGGETGIYWLLAMTDYWASPMTDYWDSVMGISVNVVLEEGDVTETTVSVVPETGTSAVLASASTLRAGLLSKAKFDEIEANTAKVGAATSLSMGTIGANTIAITSDGGVDDVTLPAATVTTAGVATAAQITAISHTAGMVRDNANPLLGLDLHSTAITSHSLVTVASDDYILISDTSHSEVLKKILVSDIQASGSFELVDDTTPELGGTLQFGANEATGLTGNRMLEQSAGSVVFGYNTEFPGYTLVLGNDYGTVQFGEWIASELYFSHLIDDFGTLGISGKSLKNIHTSKITLGGVERSTWPTVTGGHDPVTLAASALEEGLVLSTQSLSYNNPAKIKIGIIGDSLADAFIPLGSWVTYFKAYAEQTGVQITIANTAVGGASLVARSGTTSILTTDTHGWNGAAETDTQYETIVDFAPDIVFIIVGANDTLTQPATGYNITTIKTASRTLTDSLDAALPGVKLVYLSAIGYDKYDAVLNTDGVLIANVAAWTQNSIVPYLMDGVAHLNLDAGAFNVRIGGNISPNPFLTDAISVLNRYNYTQWDALDTHFRAASTVDAVIDINMWDIYRAGSTYDTAHPGEFGARMMAVPVAQWFNQYLYDNSIISGTALHALSREIAMDATAFHPADAIYATDPQSVMQYGNKFNVNLVGKRGSWMFQDSALEFYITPDVSEPRHIVYRVKHAYPGAEVLIGFEPSSAVYGGDANDLDAQKTHTMYVDANGYFEISAAVADIRVAFPAYTTYDACIAVQGSTPGSGVLNMWNVYYEQVTIYLPS